MSFSAPTYRVYIPHYHPSYGHSSSHSDAEFPVAVGLFAILVLLYLVFLLWQVWRKRKKSH